MRGFSGGEILRGRYPLVWQKVLCYKCGGIGHKRSDHREKTKKEEKKELEKKSEKEEKKIEEIKNKGKTKKVKKDKKKIKKRDIGIETVREEIEIIKKKDVEIVTEKEIVVEKIDEKREIEIRE